MRIRFCTFLVTAVWAASALAAGSIPALPSMYDPALSPDASQIAFVSGSDIWTVSSAGGQARLLVSHPATESRPLYSPDGTKVAFVSTRTGNGDIYILTLATGQLSRLTWDDSFDQLDNWSRDGKWIYFSSVTADASGMNDIYRVSSSGGTPMAVSSDRYVNEYEAAPSPDGSSLAFIGHGLGSSQWWRHGTSHIDESEVWLLTLNGAAQYRQVTKGGAKVLWPMWSRDGSRLFYMSGRDGNENIWSSTLDGKETKITSFTSGRLLWPSISADGRTIAYERDFAIGLLDTATGSTRMVPITLFGSPATPDQAFRTYSRDFDELALSPDGKKVAIIVHGEVFAGSSKDGAEAARVTSTAEREYHVRWSPDSRKLVYGSSRSGAAHIYLYDFVTGAEKQLTSGAGADLRPQFSPDGKSVAFVRGGRELRIIDLASNEDRLVATADIDDARPFESTRPFVWSPDSHWIAFMSNGARLFRNASVINVSNGSSTPIAVSFVGNVFNDTLAWAPDGTSLFFDTGQRTEPGAVARVWLVPHTPSFHETQFRDLFHEETPKSMPPSDKPQPDKAEKPAAPVEAAKSKPVEIVPEDIRKRLSLLPIDLDVQYVTVSPDSKFLLMIASAIGQENLFSFSLDELSRQAPVPHQLTSSPGQIAYAEFSPDSKEIFFLKDGQVFSIPAEGGPLKPLGITASMNVDFGREKDQSFREAWEWERVHFHDRGMHGADWNAVHEAFAPRVEAAATPDEFHRLLNLMVGELNASHLGSRSGGRTSRTTGRIGLRFDRNEYEQSGKLRITEVLPLGPAAVTRKIAVGDYLLAIDGSSVGAGTAIAEILENKIGREVRLTLAGNAGANRRDVSVQPVDANVAKELIYDDWVEKNRAYIDRISGGKLGYVHMADMSYDSLLKLSRDLDAINATRDGVIFDIRNNNGGFVNAFALDILSRKHYLNMAPRGRSATPARTLLGQRSLERPTVLLTNRHSLSDAEDFSEGYRSMHIGKVIGEPTAGWIIYTGNVTLLDGSIFRLPSTTITTADGEEMEMHPRPVDIAVENAIGEATDSQIDRAVKELSRP